MTSAPAPGVSGDRLIVPDGLLIEPHAIERLRQTLAAADPSVAGVVAVVAAVPAGSSHRVHAERCSLTSPDDPGVVREASESGIEGVALVRADVSVEVDGHRVGVPGGRLLLDAGAVSHDPRRAPGPVHPDLVVEAPPFPWRPVVAWLAVEPCSDERRVWLGRMTDELLGLDIESRLLLDPAPGPPHLIGPLPPLPDAVLAVRPEVIVALDPAAEELVDRLAGLTRATTVVRFDGSVGTIDLVPWTVGRAEGRRRAHIGPGAGPAELAVLFRRLVAGPQPVAPAVTWVAAPAPAGSGGGADHGG